MSGQIETVSITGRTSGDTESKRDSVTPHADLLFTSELAQRRCSYFDMAPCTASCLTLKISIMRRPHPNNRSPRVSPAGGSLGGYGRREISIAAR